MLACVACGVWGAAPLCSRCRRSLSVGPSADVGERLFVQSALRHTGAARRLVHRLKYEASSDAAEILGAFMETRIPPEAEALVPVPRALARRLRYGIDPALALARVLAGRTGIPVVRALAPALWWPRHANAGRRSQPVFRRKHRVAGPVVLIDDVITTGATLVGAVEALGVSFGHGLTATAPIRMVQQTVEVPRGTEEVA